MSQRLEENINIADCDCKIAVILPVYNAEAYLDDAITSILNQTFTQFKLVIINDGSNDNSDKIISSYKDPRIVYYKQDLNQGLISTLNFGILHSNCKYIARMDADDIAQPNRLKTQFDFMEAHPEVDVCGSWVQTFGNSTEIWRVPIENSEIKARLLFENAMCHPSVMMRYSSLVKPEETYDPNFLHQEDYYLWWSKISKWKYHNLPEILLNYRQSNANITNLNSATKNDRLKKIYSIIFSDLELKLDQQYLILHYYGFQFGYQFPTNSAIKLYYRHLKAVERNAIKLPYIEKRALGKEISMRWHSSFLAVLRRRGVVGAFCFWIIGKSIKRKEIGLLLKYLLRPNKFKVQSTYELL